MEIMQKGTHGTETKRSREKAQREIKGARVQSGSKQWVISRLIDPAKFQKSQNNPLIEV